MTYKETLTKAMDILALDPLVRFVGYNTAKGPRMNGTLNNISYDQCIETPVAENLMCGIAMGLALEGYKPVLCFERMDFTLACADALINGISTLECYGAKFPMIIRVCVGSKEPLDPGLQHRQDYSTLFQDKFDGGRILDKSCILHQYDFRDKAIMLVEYKEKYND